MDDYITVAFFGLVSGTCICHTTPSLNTAIINHDKENTHILMKGELFIAADYARSQLT